MTFSQAFGHVLRQMRTQHGLTLRQVAADAFISIGFLSEIERGQKECSSGVMEAIASGLGIRLSLLLRKAADVMDEADLRAFRRELIQPQPTP